MTKLVNLSILLTLLLFLSYMFFNVLFFPILFIVIVNNIAMLYFAKKNNVLSLVHITLFVSFLPVVFLGVFNGL